MTTHSPRISRRTLLSAIPAAMLASQLPSALGARSKEERYRELVRTANQQFAGNLYTQLAKENVGKNLFMSPLSLSYALTMTMEGARGKTADELGVGLGFAKGRPDFEKGAIHQATSKVMQSLNAEKSYDLHLANALWMEKTFPVNPSFVSALNGHYDSAIHKADFSGNPNDERMKINRWVEQVTNDRIKKLLPPDSVDSLTRFVIANAIYFKADWKTQFVESLTREAPFTLADGTKRNVEMMGMRRQGSFQYARLNEAGGFKVISLPYKDDAISMLIALPDKADGLPAVEAEFRRGKMNAWLSKLYSAKVSVRLPKFKMEADYTLNSTLAKMGMPSLFTGGLEGMAADPAQGRDLYVSLVKQKTFLEVDEKGTEAAAATAVVVTKRSVSRPHFFNADHPFLFALRDNKTNSLLFVGRYVSPDA